MKEYIKALLNRLALFLVGCIVWTRPLQNGGTLIVRSDNLGDLLLFLPALQTLVKRYEHQKLTLLVSEAAAECAAGLEARGIRIDELIVVNRKRFNAHLFYKIAILYRLRRAGFELALAPAISRDSIVDTLIAGTAAARRIGWRRIGVTLPIRVSELYDRAYTELLECPVTLQRELDRNEKFVKTLGGEIAEQDRLPTVQSNLADEAAASRLMREYGLESGRFVIVIPGAGQRYRLWPLQRYARVIEYLSSMGYAVVLCGSAGDKKLAREIMSLTTAPVTDLCGQTPLYVLAALLTKARLCVGNETGTIHLAAAVGAPVVCLMGGGHFGRFFPQADNPRQRIVSQVPTACLNDDWACGRNLKSGKVAPCIAAISVEAVISELARLNESLDFS